MPNYVCSFVHLLIYLFICSFALWFVWLSLIYQIAPDLIRTWLLYKSDSHKKLTRIYSLLLTHNLTLTQIRQNKRGQRRSRVNGLTFTPVVLRQWYWMKRIRRPPLQRKAHFGARVLSWLLSWVHIWSISNLPPISTLPLISTLPPISTLPLISTLPSIDLCVLDRLRGMQPKAYPNHH